MRETVRQDWLLFRDRADQEAIEAKESQAALVALQDRYGSLSPDEMLIVDELLAEWLSSADESLRFDAIAMIDANHIESALSALRELSKRLSMDPHPGAPYERAKVERAIVRLQD